MTKSDLERAAHYSERFNSSQDRACATEDLASQGKGAVPILKAIFSGESKNEFGVAYRSLGQPLLCSYVTVGKLGSLASELEPYVRAGIEDGAVYAVEAIGRMGPLSDDAIRSLAARLRHVGVVAWDAAHVLQAHGELGNLMVTESTADHSQAQKIISASRYWAGLRSRS